MRRPRALAILEPLLRETWGERGEVLVDEIARWLSLPRERQHDGCVVCGRGSPSVSLVAWARDGEGVAFGRVVAAAGRNAAATICARCIGDARRALDRVREGTPPPPRDMVLAETLRAIEDHSDRDALASLLQEWSAKAAPLSTGRGRCAACEDDAFVIVTLGSLSLCGPCLSRAARAAA